MLARSLFGWIFRFVFTCLVCSSVVLAQDECIQGSPSDMRLVKAFRDEKNADPVIRAFWQARRRSSAENAPPAVPSRGFCIFCDRGTERVQQEISRAQGLIRGELAVKKQISMKCILGALRRSSGTTAYACANDRAPASGKQNVVTVGPKGPCITQDLAEYMQFALQQAMECFSEAAEPIDPRVIFKKINNESAFHFYQAYDGGVGLGQLTNIAVKQLTKNDTSLMTDDVLASPKPACAPFKQIVQEDLAAGRARMPKPHYCYWTAPNRGLARNIIFSIGLYIYNRDLLAEIYPHLKGAALDYAALAAFGPGGLLEAQRIGKSGAKTAKQVVGQSNYLRKTQAEWEKVKGLIAGGVGSRDWSGDECVEPVGSGTSMRPGY